MTTDADFRRKVGTDPAKWAEAFVAAYVRDGMAEASARGHAEYIARWFRDAMDAAAARAKWDVQGDCLKLIDNLVRHDD